MAAYFLSDTHLRLDRPGRGRRLAEWAGRLDPGADRLVIVGDLCDFWFASRQHRADPLCCPGLRALAEFRRRGGALTILPGNHDQWLGPLYERALGARFVPEPLEVEAFGLRLHLVHGHRLGARSAWKAVMESRLFLEGFRRVPGPLARGLETLLDRSNDQNYTSMVERHRVLFRQYARRLAGRFDLVVFGHVHEPLDDPEADPRVIVLGGGRRGLCYLKIDESGASHVTGLGAEIDDQGRLLAH